MLLYLLCQTQFTQAVILVHLSRNTKMRQNETKSHNLQKEVDTFPLSPCQQAAADLLPAGGAGGAARLLAATPRLHPHLHTPAGQNSLSHLCVKQNIKQFGVKMKGQFY